MARRPDQAIRYRRRCVRGGDPWPSAERGNRSLAARIARAAIATRADAALSEQSFPFAILVARALARTRLAAVYNQRP
jgi:hypothetical protein